MKCLIHFSQSENITICKDQSPTLESTIDMCVYSLFFSKHFFNYNCTSKSIHYDNYFIQTSNNHILCALVKSIAILISYKNSVNNSTFLKSNKQISKILQIASKKIKPLL